MALTFQTSYVFLNYSFTGWSSAYFFTYYSEFSDEPIETTIEVAILTIIFLMSIMANVAIAWAVLRYREMRTVTNCFLLNLTVADLLFAITTPAIAYVRVEPDWAFGDGFCKFLPYSQFVCGFVLLWTLTLISMDRHQCIVVPPYRSRLTPRRAAFLTVLTWLIGLIVFLPVVFWFGEKRGQVGEKIGLQTVRVCTLEFPKNNWVSLSIVFTVSVVSLCCVLPLSMFVYHYQQIFHKLNKTRQRIKSCSTVHRKKSRRTRKDGQSAAAMENTVPQVLVQHEEHRYKRHVRVVRVLLINVIVVLVMWLPITVMMCLLYWDGSRPEEDHDYFLRSHHFMHCLMIALLNTVVNPILYGALSENFRQCFRRLWFVSKRRRAVARELLTTQGYRTPSNGPGNSTQHPNSTASVIDIPVTVIASNSSSVTNNNCW